MISATARFTPRGDLGQFTEIHVSPLVHETVQAAGEMIQIEARAFCPVDTGALRDSITVVVTDSAKSSTAAVGPTMHYAAYVEFGTGIRGASSPDAGKGPYSKTWPGMEPRPYMRPALELTREPIKDLFRSNVSLGIRT